MFEVLSLFPLFPGTNELDQIQKIHNVLGTPSAEVLAKFKRSAHMNFNFPQKTGTGIDKLLPNGTPDAIDLIKKLLVYNPDDRYSAGQALKHPYFRDIREAEKGTKLSYRQESLVSHTQESASEVNY
jgi:renal tumor antigen